MAYLSQQTRGIVSEESLFDREKIITAFEKLDSELARRRLRVDMFVTGGAAIILAYQRDRRTRDIDAVFTSRSEVYEAARAVARRMGLPQGWLNDAVESYLLDDDPEMVPVFEGQQVHVAVASPQYLLAMKLLAARAEQDSGDVALLMQRCGYTTTAEAVAFLERYLPGKPIPEKTLDLLEAMYGPLEGLGDYGQPGRS